MGGILVIGWFENKDFIFICILFYRVGLVGGRVLV